MFSFLSSVPDLFKSSLLSEESEEFLVLYNSSACLWLILVKLLEAVFNSSISFEDNFD